jgi:hypothetical protein
MSNLYIDDSGQKVSVAELALLTGKQQAIIGNNDRDLILRTSGKIQIQVGNKFYPLSFITDTTTASTNLVISSKTTILALDSNLSTLAYPGDGNYVYIKQSKSFYIASANSYTQINPKTTANAQTILYLSYNTNQNLSGAQKLTLTLNQGNITSFADINAYTKNDVYVNQLLYSINDTRHYYLSDGLNPSIKASWKELYLSLSTGGNVHGPISIGLNNTLSTTNSALHIKGDSPALFKIPDTPTPLLTIGADDYTSGLAAWTNSGDVYLKLLDTHYHAGFYFQTFNPTGTVSSPLSISSNSVGIGGPFDYNYNLAVSGKALFRNNVILNGTITSNDFVKGSTGFGISKDGSANWIIEADYIVARKTTASDPANITSSISTSGLNGLQVVNYDIIITDADYVESFPIYIKASVSGHYTDNVGTIRLLSTRGNKANVKHIPIANLDTLSPVQVYETITLGYTIGDIYANGTPDTTTTYNKVNGGAYYTPVGNTRYDGISNTFIADVAGTLLQINSISVYYIKSNITNLRAGDLLYYKSWNANKQFMTHLHAQIVSITADGGYYIYIYDGGSIAIGTKFVKVGNVDGTGALLQTNASDLLNPYTELVSGITSLNQIHGDYYYDQTTDFIEYDFIQDNKTTQANTRVKIGDLSNIVDSTLGLSTQQYGLYSDNAYLKGNFVLNSAIFTTVPTVSTYENFLMLHTDHTLEQINMSVPFAYWNAKADNTITITASGSGITGGGNLTANRTISLDFTFLDARYADAVTSVFGRVGAVVAQSGDYNTSQITELTQLYYTNTRAINSLLTGYSAGSGTITASDSILAAIQKLSGNISLINGAIVYKGLWNATTNSPALASGVGTTGWLYKVSVAGSTNLDGITQWNIGDQVVFDGLTWDKINGITNEVISFNTRVGAIVLTSADVTTALAYTPYNATNPSNYITLTGISATSPILYNNATGVISSQNATTSQNGILTSTDWNTFNAKQSALSGTGLVRLTGSTLTYDNTTYLTAANNLSDISNINTAQQNLGITQIFTNITRTQSSTINSYVEIGTLQLSPAVDPNGGYLTNMLVRVVMTANQGTPPTFQPCILEFDVVANFWSLNGSWQNFIPVLKSGLNSNYANETIIQGFYTNAGGGTGYLKLRLMSSSINSGSTFDWRITMYAIRPVGLTFTPSTATGTDATVYTGPNNMFIRDYMNNLFTIFRPTTMSSTLNVIGIVTGASFTGAGTGLTGLASGLSIGGNSNTSTTLATARTINGVSFDGSANITVTAAGNTLTGTILNPTIVTSSLTSLGTITTGVWNGTAIANANLANSSVTVQGLSVSLGGSINPISGTGFVKVVGTTLSYDNNTYLSAASAAATYAPLTGAGTSGTWGINISGNALTATTLQTARAINGTSFDGSAAITITAAATSLTGNTLNSTVINSSLTSVGTLTAGIWNATPIANIYLANSSITINGSAVALGGSITIGSSPVLRTGTSVKCDVESIYGTIASPITGNITFDSTSATVGIVAQMIHNNSSAPTFDVNFRKLSGSGAYVNSTVNYIFMEYISSGEVIYTIQQRT